VGSGWRGGISVEGGSGGVAASSGAVLWLEAEVREGVAGAASGRDEKHGAGEKIRPVVGGSALLKGVAGAEGGPRSRVTRGAEQGRERGAQA
jgi:hypothetical protein